MASLRVSGLRKSLGSFRLGPISFVVRRETLVVIGENGAGKTTLLNLIAGLLRPDEGEISIDGVMVNGLPVEKRGIGYVFQKPYLFPHMNVYENIAYGVKQGCDEKIVYEAAELLRIKHLLKSRINSLSGGEQQRVALARTLAARPKVLLLDEPLNHLDAPTRRRLRRELRDLFKNLEIPVIYVSHDSADVYEMADVVLVLKNGSVAGYGSVNELEESGDEYVKDLLER